MTGLKRYHYRRMTAEQFRAALREVGLDGPAFAWITGANENRVRRWLNGQDEDIPPWVTVFCALLTLPGAPDLATSVARDFSTVREDGEHD